MNQPFILTCDASSSAIGYILSQIGEDNKEHVIAYEGRTLRTCEQNYTITELKFLSIIEAVRQYHVYLTNQPFKIYTDHKAITYIKNIKSDNPRLIRWAFKLQNLDFTVVYKEDPKNTAADCLSRRTYKPEEKSETDQPKYDDEIPDPREIIEISFQYADDDMNIGALEEMT